MASTIQLKRGKAASWTSQNILLLAGEPGYEMDTGRFKVGNGKDKWNDLPYVDDHGAELFNAPTHYDFPSVGQVDVIYKAEAEKLLYQWNSLTSSYEVISNPTGEGGDSLLDFDVIYGGDANDYK